MRLGTYYHPKISEAIRTLSRLDTLIAVDLGENSKVYREVAPSLKRVVDSLKEADRLIGAEESIPKGFLGRLARVLETGKRQAFIFGVGGWLIGVASAVIALPPIQQWFLPSDPEAPTAPETPKRGEGSPAESPAEVADDVGEPTASGGFPPVREPAATGRDPEVRKTAKRNGRSERDPEREDTVAAVGRPTETVPTEKEEQTVVPTVTEAAHEGLAGVERGELEPGHPPEPSETANAGSGGPPVRSPRLVETPRTECGRVPRSLKIREVVVVMVLVSERGEVTETSISGRAPAWLQEEAARVAKAAKFFPGERNGMPISSWFKLSINFECGSEE